MGTFIGFLLIVGLIVWGIVAIREKIQCSKEFKSLVREAYSGNCKAIRDLGILFNSGYVPEKFYGNFMPQEAREARKYILYALAEFLDDGKFYLDSEIERGDYNTIDSVNLAREFVEVCIEKYGDKAMDKVLDVVLARNLKIQ